jgi:hypothetical protein
MTLTHSKAASRRGSSRVATRSRAATRYGDTAAPVKPAAIDTAFLLWLVAAGVSILSGILGFFTAGALVEEALSDLGELGPEVRAAVEAQGPSYGGIIFSLVISAIWVLVVMQMRKGANWARILLTVLGAISVLFGIFGIFVLFSIGFLGIIQGLLSLVGYVAIVGGIIFMFKPESSQYFKATS